MNDRRRRKAVTPVKMLVFGSLNIDHTYRVPHLVREGETLDSQAYQRNTGGKGLNQAIALAKAGQECWFAGAIGEDGGFLKACLDDYGIHTEFIRPVKEPTGHAIIQVDDRGKNSIVLFGGANRAVTPAMIEEVLSSFDPGDYLLMQNEISCGDVLLHAAAEKGMHVALNPSPLTENLLRWPLEEADWLILNEVEGAGITGKQLPDEILDALTSRYPACHAVLTLGEKGSVYAEGNLRVRQESYPVRTVDTTAAGDTFTGFLLHAILQGKTISQALKTASRAAALAVSRPGASASIPWQKEVRAAFAQAGEENGKEP